MIDGERCVNEPASSFRIFCTRSRSATRARARTRSAVPSKAASRRRRSCSPMCAQEHDHTVVGRLTAGCASVGGARGVPARLSGTTWTAGQTLQAIALDPDSAAVDQSYRQRLFKGLVTALQKLDVERTRACSRLT